MKIINKFIAIQINEIRAKHFTVDSKHAYQVNPTFSFGHRNNFNDNELPIQQTFDSYELALQYAFEMNKHAKWIILPTVQFISDYEIE